MNLRSKLVPGRQAKRQLPCTTAHNTEHARGFRRLQQTTKTTTQKKRSRSTKNTRHCLLLGVRVRQLPSFCGSETPCVWAFNRQSFFMNVVMVKWSAVAFNRTQSSTSKRSRKDQKHTQHNLHERRYHHVQKQHEEASRHHHHERTNERTTQTAHSISFIASQNYFDNNATTNERRQDTTQPAPFTLSE